MSSPRNVEAFQPSRAAAFSYEGTSATNSGTTARAIPDTSAQQVLVTNLDSAIVQYVAFGGSSGGDAGTGTTRMVLPPYSAQVFSLRLGDTHAYFQSASGTPSYSMVSGRGY